MPKEMSFKVCDFKSAQAGDQMMPDWTLARTMHAPFAGQMDNPVAFPNTKKADVLWECSKNQTVSGYIGLSSIDSKNSHCELVFMFEGNAAEYISLAVRHAFDNMGLQRVHCLVPVGNPSCAILEEMGFKNEAVMRKHCLVGGKYCDINWYGLLRSESDWEND